MLSENGVEYRDIPGFPNYRAGSDGTIWSRKRFGPGWRRLKPCLKDRGYLGVAPRCNGKAVNKKVHSLILEAFIGPRQNGYEACHRNGIKTDNRIENLRWGTKADNQADKIAHGTQCRGEKNGSAKLTVERVIEIRSRFAAGGISKKRLASEYHVTHGAIRHVISGLTWSHISSKHAMSPL